MIQVYLVTGISSSHLFQTGGSNTMLRAPGASSSTSLLCGNQAAPHHLSVDSENECDVDFLDAGNGEDLMFRECVCQSVSPKVFSCCLYMLISGWKDRWWIDTKTKSTWFPFSCEHRSEGFAIPTQGNTDLVPYSKSATFTLDSKTPPRMHNCCLWNRFLAKYNQTWGYNNTIILLYYHRRNF